jgi:uncharacterized protein YccT (UPF0319 family)
MSLDAITVVTAFLMVCFRSLLLADLNSSSSGRMSSTSLGGKQESGSLVSDMARFKRVDDGRYQVICCARVLVYGRKKSRRSCSSKFDKIAI